MKKNYNIRKCHAMKSGIFRISFTALLIVCLNSAETFAQQQTYSFTTAGATGSVGPAQGQVNAAYALTNLNGAVQVIGSGIQSWTVPTSGLYSIDATGASGGNTNSTYSKLGGFGAHIVGEFNLTAGDVLHILVGQKGPDGCGTAGGGGGSFITANNVLLLAAGAGGGASSDNNAAHATTANSGTADNPAVSAGGTNGSGGQTCMSSVNNGGGGGGYSGDGVSAPSGGGGGSAFTNGGAGGVSAATANPPGGFGGGGGGTNCTVGGGGGGGYSGGAGGQQVGYCNSGVNRSGGGGGGSYNNGTNQNNSVLNVTGDGRVIIKTLCNISLNSTQNPICIGSSIVLSTDAASGILWNTGATTNSISVSPNVTTTYSVTGTSTANCIASSVLTVVVNPLPVINAVMTPTTLCVGKAATVTASGASTYTWNTMDVGPTVTLNPVVTTVYTISATSNAGCFNTGTVVVNVNSNSLTLTSNTAVCLGSSIDLYASGANNYVWSTGGLFPKITVSPATNTIYTVSGLDEHSCTLTGSVSVSVKPIPTVTAAAEKSKVCRGETVPLIAGGATNYTWNTGATTPTISFNFAVDIPYNFTVTGTDESGCSNTAFLTVNVDKCTGLIEIQQEKLRVYPTPVISELIVELDNGYTKYLEVSDISGRLVFSASGSEARIKADLRHLSNGVYYISVTSNNQTEVIKFVKQSD